MTDDVIIYSVIFTTLIILLLIAGVAITIFIANKQRITQEIKMTQLQLSYEQELRTVQQEVWDQVLTNVARELHDNIGQILTVMHIQLEQKKMLKPELTGILDPIHETLRTAVQQVRFLGRTVNIDALEKNGLLHTIQIEITRMEQFSHFTLHWTNDNQEPILDKNQRLMAFRIFQEMINNTLKHAEAKNIYVSFTGKNHFVLEVKDDGKGFDLNEKLQSAKGEGLKNMIKRASLADLRCTIMAEEGKGCKFTLEKVSV